MAKRVKIIGRKFREPIFTASSLLATARQFFKSAEIVQRACPNKPNGTPILNCFKARYFLLGHAIETGLKAFLFLKERSKRNLKKIKGHDLLSILKDAKSLGFLCLSTTEENMIADLNKHYFKKDFEYEEVDYSKLPVIRDLLMLTKKLLDLVEKEIKRK